MEYETGVAPAVVAPASALRRAVPYLRFAAQFVFAAALLALLLWRVDISAVRDDLRGASLWWLAPAFFFNIVSDLFRAVRWREFFRPLRHVRAFFLFKVAVLGVACNLAMPLRAGEFLRLQLLRRRTGLEVPQIVATIVSEKLMDTVAFSAFLVLGFVLYDEARFMWPLAVVYGFVLVGGVWAARVWARRSLEESAARLVPQPEGRWRVWLAAQARSFGTGLQSFRSNRSLAIVSGASVVAWLCESVMYYCAGQSLGLDLDPAVYLLVVVAATVAVSVPITQAGLGVFEIALTGLLVAFGVDKSEAAAFAIFSHVMLAVPYFISGPIAAVALRLNLSDVLFVRSAPQEA